MSHFEIKVRNLETDETLIATLDSYEDALIWLRERPHLMEVVTVLSDVSPKQMQELKEAMRPYDDDEKSHMSNRAAETIEAVRRVREAEEARAAAEEKLAREAAKSADPNRPMKVRWSIETGFSNADAFDDRAITAAAEKAILEWVAERNEWVAERGQIVGEAEVEVYPNEVPEGASRVLRGGQFTPRFRGAEA